jgi:phosphatidylglycerophosphatase A
MTTRCVMSRGGKGSGASAVTRLAYVLATWFGCGLSPIAPGTAGSLAAIAIAYLLPWPPLAFGIAAVVITPIGIWAAGVTANQLRREDPGLVVIDEVAGQWLTLAGAGTINWKSLLIGFALFRLFDIWKPFPVNRLERLPGGLGIMADDLGAGLYGALVIFVVGRLLLY